MKRTIEYLKASMLAGAIGDAWGWPIEFQTVEEINSKYGRQGLTKLIKNTYGIVEITEIGRAHV